MKYLQTEWRSILKQGALLMLALLVAGIGLYVLVYQLSWASNPHWIEAHRDRWKLGVLPENVHWFWIHEDSQYWIMRLRFDKGPVTLEGLPPEARYWSVTYYAGNEENPSINMQSMELNADGTYRITFTQTPDGSPNEIPVGPEVRKGIIELRITLQELEEPVLLPDVSQNETVIAEGRH
jgi:hypothetical protein